MFWINRFSCQRVRQLPVIMFLNIEMFKGLADNHYSAFCAEYVLFISYSYKHGVLGQWWATFLPCIAGSKYVVIFIAGRTHNSSQGTHNIHPYHFFSSGGLVGSRAKCGPRAVDPPCFRISNVRWKALFREKQLASHGVY